MKLFYLKDSAAYDFKVEDSVGNLLGTLANNNKKDAPNTTYLKLPSLTSQIVLRAQKMSDAQNNATIFGLELENESDGITYSSIGVNGVEAYQYARATYFAEQTAELHADFIIISLGTNEGQHRPLDKPLHYARLDSMVTQLQQFNPGVPILLTTPPDSYYRRKNYNTSIGAIHEVIVDYARDHQLPCWDLYSIAGGYKSAYQWKKSKMMGSDGIHFGRGGYEFQGNLLYEAIIKAYNQYVANRPK